MPTGQKTIVWTAENDERLLLSILAAHDIKVDNVKVAEVFGTNSETPIFHADSLQVFGKCPTSGNNIAPSVIQTRMKKLKAKARGLNPGVVPTTAAVTAPGTTATKRKPVNKKNDGASSKKVKQGSTEDEEDIIDDLIGAQINGVHGQHVTPPATPNKKPGDNLTKTSKSTTPSPAGGDKVLNSRVEEKRCSRRDSTKPNYRQLDDPFIFMEDAIDDHGKNVFGQPARTESEDSFDTDKDFDAEKILNQI